MSLNPDTAITHYYRLRLLQVLLAADLQDIVNCLGLADNVQANANDIRYALLLSWSEALEDEVFKLIKHRLAQ